jgi:hypothetical protein
MVEHDELMRRAVEGLRASRSPTAGAEARVLATLQLQLGGPPGGGEPGGGASTDGGAGMTAGSAAASGTPATMAWVAKVVGATVALTAGGLLAVQVGIGALQGPTAEKQPIADEVVAVAETQPEEPHGEQAQPPEEELEAIPVTPGTLPKPRVQAPTQVEVEPGDALAAELELIEAAKRASIPSVALERLEQHARDFPNGTMASEREALAVVALCQLDRPQDARTRARRLVAKRPGLPLLERMRSECPVLTDLLRQKTP